MGGYRRSRQAGITHAEAHYRRSKNALHEKLRGASDPEQRVLLCLDYLRAALRHARSRGYALDRGPGKSVVETVTRSLIKAGDQLLRPSHGGR